tara:strand:+ start:52697 stop:52813 length:117 start_codon:yes stop_codon:yes gene_type:complete
MGKVKSGMVAPQTNAQTKQKRQRYIARSNNNDFMIIDI